MGISLIDNTNEGNYFDINFWHWRAIVEVVHKLQVLPVDVVKGLHEPFTGSGLSVEQARMVSVALREHLLPQLVEGERLLFDGTTCMEPDDGVFHRVEIEQNYSTNREVLERFAVYCETCAGFEVC